MELISEYAASGFVSSGDALSLDYVLRADEEGCPFFRAGYVKGMARSCTLLALLFGFYKGEIDIKTWPHYALLNDIHARIEDVSLDREGVALRNALLSQRGSIRRSHDIFTWAAKMRLMQSAGCDAAATIKNGMMWHQNRHNSLEESE